MFSGVRASNPQCQRRLDRPLCGGDNCQAGVERKWGWGLGAGDLSRSEEIDAVGFGEDGGEVELRHSSPCINVGIWGWCTCTRFTPLRIPPRRGGGGWKNLKST